MFYKTGKKNRVIAFFIWMLMPMLALAHSTSQSSTVLVETKNGQWTLQVRAALSAFESVVNNEYTVKGYNTPEEFEQLVFNLMAKNLELTVDGQNIELSRPKIKLGHETLVVYLIDVPETFKTVTLNNTMFQNIFKSKNTFMILKNGVNRNLFALEKANNFKAKVKLEDTKFTLVNTTNSLASSGLKWYVVVFLAMLGIIGLVFKLKKKEKLIPAFNPKVVKEVV
ncbi:DUF6702 family protein [Formosa algae]|uniref:Uncharacterized protein n=1 Tax=Formosa algae TaxID=225843 RepID=A0A9X0YPE3_9FLAO|nr:DUF6702 family protein [Formosa algae]MBP1841618.1 hypothetical protein [Formosa algae]MDQ0336989.1 hypothetical protein [Formosa algae]OEI80241.1 hypothetical protein AST99_10680 [Formosa algae]